VIRKLYRIEKFPEKAKAFLSIVKKCKRVSDPELSEEWLSC
jgi:hypothetical protein